MLIKVERGHIREGAADDPEYCPIALAMADAMGEESNPYVNHHHAFWSDSAEGRVGRELPKIAREFSSEFDSEWEKLFPNMGRFKPFEFELEAREPRSDWEQGNRTNAQ